MISREKKNIFVMKKSHLQKYIFKQKVYFTLRLCGKSTKMTKRETYAQGKRNVFLGGDKCRIAVKDVLEEPMKLYLQYVGTSTFY